MEELPRAVALPPVSRVCVPVFLVEQTGNPRRIFVGDLPTEFNKEELAKAFAKFGNVESTRLNAPRGSVPFVWAPVTAAVRVHHNGGLRAGCVRVAFIVVYFERRERVH